MAKKLTSKMIKSYLIDCKGYDEYMIDDLTDIVGRLTSDILSASELFDCINYNR